MSASPIDPKDFYIHHQKNATIVRLPGSINGLDLMIEDLDDCTVYILDHSAQITVDYCNNTRFVIGPVDGPFFIRNCVNCTVSVACRQLRTRECVNTDFYLYCATKSPIIESSTNLRFHQFDIAYPHLTQQFISAKMDPEVNHNDLIYDFSKEDATIPQPHYTIVPTIPPLIQLRCFLDGNEIDGDFKDTPIKVAYPSSSELKVEKITGSSPSPQPSTSPTATATAVSPTESAKMQSFGSSSSTKMESFGSDSVGSVAKMESFGSSSVKMESFGSGSVAAAKTEPTATAKFEAGVAPSIPEEQPKEPESTTSTSEAPSAVEPVAASSIEPSTDEVATSANPTVASSEVSSPVVVKDASFSILTSAEEASRALFALAGVTYVPPTPAKPIEPVPAATLPAASPSPPVDEEKALENWFANTPGMLSSSHAEPLPEVAAAEAARILALEERRVEAERKSEEHKLASQHALKEFYDQRQEEQRKAMKARREAQAQENQLHNNNVSDASSASTASSSSAATPSSSAAASFLSSLPTSASASLNGFDKSWSEVLSMLPESAKERNGGMDLMKMKLMYSQLKSQHQQQQSKVDEATRAVKREEKKQRKREKKKKKKAKKKALLAALAASPDGKVDQAALVAAALSSDSSDSSSSDEGE